MSEDAGSGGDSLQDRGPDSGRSHRQPFPSTSRNGAVPEHQQRRLAGGPGRQGPPEAANEAGDGEEEESEEESGQGSERAEPDEDHTDRRMLRQQYRQLINRVQRKPGDRPGSGVREGDLCSYGAGTVRSWAVAGAPGR